MPTFPAIVLNESWDGSPKKVQDLIRLLGAAFNNRNGKGIDRHEIQQVIERLVSQIGDNSTKIVSVLGVTVGTVQNFLYEKHAKERAEKLRVHVNPSLNASQLRLLGSTAAVLKDEPFRDSFNLVQSADMKVEDASGLLKNIIECPSEAKSIA
jgi:hypothetical protein